MTNYEVGDVVLVAFPQSAGGPPKKRPALVVLDIGDDDIVLAPITTRERRGPGDCHLSHWSAAGLLRESWVRLAKVVCLLKADVTRSLGHIAQPDVDGVTETWKDIFALCSGAQDR